MTLPNSLRAAIFDMDGVLIDSNPYHLQKWVELLSARGIAYKPEDLRQKVLGHTADVPIRFFLGSQLSKEDRDKLRDELEEKFRQSFPPQAKPLPGLEPLIGECQRAGLSLAVASAAPAKNVETIVDALGFRPYFRCLITGDEVARPKPDPEIYIKAAEKLGLDPAACVAFEDSFAGVESAKRAGMKCIAIASTLPVEELRAHTQADLAVRSFKELGIDALRNLFCQDN